MMKKKEEKRVPQLRFPEFTDDWEQRKLDEVVERITRKNENLESTLPLTISAQYGLIDQNEFFDKRIASKDVSGYYLIRKGEFAYNKSTSSDAPWGAIKRLDRYENGVLSTLYIVFKILDEDKTSSDYLATYYSTELWHKGVQAIAAEGARNHGLLNITPADFFKTDLMLPTNISEQQKIGAYFKQLDHLITLHQRKLKNLNVLKKGVMQKLFSQKIRFKADDGSEFPEWEEKKLDDVAVRVTRKNKDNITDIPLTISSADGLIDQRDFFNKVVASKDMSGYYLLKKGEFAYNKSYSKGYDFGSIKKLDLYAEGALSTLYICFALNKDENPDFYQKYFDSLFWYLELQKICAEGARNHGLLNVSTNEFFQMKLKVPSSKQEQKKIADCLSSLDDVIEKQKVTLAAWEEMKKGLLQQMFV